MRRLILTTMRYSVYIGRIGNEQEYFRQALEAINFGITIDNSLSSNIDNVTLYEIYLWLFADAVRAGVKLRYIFLSTGEQ